MNEQEIREIFEEEHRMVLLILEHENIYPKWIHPFKSLQLINSKTRYGGASPKGIIKISRIFIGTKEYTSLRDTIRHELAHLIVGNQHNHDVRWQRIAYLINARPQAKHKPVGQLVNTMKRKWLLIGLLKDGRKVEFQPSHNKMSKYLRAKPCSHSCPQGDIVKFYYIRNK